MSHDVDLPLVLPDIDGRGQWVSAGRDAGIVEEQINWAKLRFGLVHQVIHRRLAGYIAGNSDAADLPGDLFAALSIDISDNNARAASGELAR